MSSCSPLLCGQHGDRVVPRIEGVGRGRGADRVVVEAAGRVDDADEGDAGEERTVGLEQEAIEAEVGVVGEEPVGFVHGQAVPLRAAVPGHDVDDAGERLAVPGGEGVGGERRLRDHRGRDPDAERVARRVELILDPDPVEDERLLPQAAAPVALPDGAGGEGDRLVDRTDGEAAQLLARLLLFGGDRQRVERRVGDRLYVDRLHRDGGGLHGQVEHRRAVRPDDQAVPGLRGVADQDRPQRVDAASHLADAVPPGRIGHGPPPAVVHAHGHVRQRGTGLRVARDPRDGPAGLRRDRGRRREQCEEGEQPRAHGAS